MILLLLLLLSTWLALLALDAATVEAIPDRSSKLSWPLPKLAASVPAVDWDALPLPPRDSSLALLAANKSPNSKSIITSSSGEEAGKRKEVPGAVDWRNRSGVNFITTVQDQGKCQSCWAFAVTALVETQIRIEHGVWSKRSEADVHHGMGALCETTGNVEDTLGLIEREGIADWACRPYSDSLRAEGCADRSGRTTRIGEGNWRAIGGIEDQKRWIDTYGPVVATFVLYDDFGGYNGSGVYNWDGKTGNTGNHIALVVGYDDAMGAWIVKNSWGGGWGDRGFAYFGYENANIDMWAKYGLAGVDVDPWARRRHWSGNMFLAGNGTRSDEFDVLFGGSQSGLFKMSENGESVTRLETVEVVDGDMKIVGQPAVVSTSFERELHAVAIDEEGNLHQWVRDETSGPWSKVSSVSGNNIDGFPGLVQSDDSALVMVVRHKDGTLNEYRQEPNSRTWRLIEPPISSGILQSGPALVQSNIGLDIYGLTGSSSGNLYTVVVRDDGRMQLFWREGNATTWKAGETFGSDVPLDTPPVMVQDYLSANDELSVGGFQLAIAVNGTVQHWTRDSKTENWSLRENAGSDVRHVWSLVQTGVENKMHMVVELFEGDFELWEWQGRWGLSKSSRQMG
ncbi:hypothetical protein QBC35DRAFT_392695 [Podospora australis]|uniref:Peptidase C1A papain C-terminal domain-containing protein n=1 Tax=Podospora australis TaxID=1536484 RepID=A0AAN7AET3_9PEZI|nr:hypothetical protein QBC35DRAFT_392695 [Podospora australis]